MIGKGENNWDKFTHAGGNVKNNDTGDVACDSYNKYKDDIKLMKDMGVSFLFGCLSCYQNLRICLISVPFFMQFLANFKFRASFVT